MGRSRRSQYNPSRKRRAARPLERVEVPEQDQPEQEELGVREQTGNCKWSSAERFSMFAMLAWTYDYSEVARAEAALYDGDVGDMVERHTSGYAQRMMRAGGEPLSLATGSPSTYFMTRNTLSSVEMPNVSTLGKHRELRDSTAPTTRRKRWR